MIAEGIVSSIHVLVIGFGDTRKNLAPALKELNEIGDISEVSIIDRRCFLELEPEKMSGYRDWAENHFFKEAEDAAFIHKIKERVGSKRGIVYLAVPPESFSQVITRYSECGDIFIIEKPWAMNKEQYDKLLGVKESLPNKTLVGIDHYLWKDEVCSFIEKMSDSDFAKALTTSETFDFVLCESDLDPATRSYFWKTGIALDMIPHVLPLLAKVFGNYECELLQIAARISNEEMIKDVLTRYKWKFPVKETYVEMMIRLSTRYGEKIIHVILSKGSSMQAIELCGDALDSAKYFSVGPGKIFLDLTRHEIIIDCKKESFNEVHSPWYTMFKSVISGRYDSFVDMSSIGKYVRLYEEISKGLHSFLKLQNGNKHFESEEYPMILLRGKNTVYEKGRVNKMLSHKQCLLS